jgi:O-acetyl-ADP-ribose deacetylase (regulator of RNase III)
MNVTKGDLIKKAKEGDFDLIVHGCNCFCTMGGGIAKGIKKEFPEAFNADQSTSKGSKEKLGTCSYARIERGGINLIVVNAYTQFDYRGMGVKVNYDAVRSCMKWIKENFTGNRIGLPKIGAGLAGGDWERISQIIDEELTGEDVTLVEYSP